MEKPNNNKRKNSINKQDRRLMIKENRNSRLKLLTLPKASIDISEKDDKHIKKIRMEYQNDDLLIFLNKLKNKRNNFTKEMLDNLEKLKNVIEKVVNCYNSE